MAYNVIQFKPPKKNQEGKIFKIDKFGGLNVAAVGNQIEYNESPDMLNMTLDEFGALDKRTGYVKFFANSLGDGKINGMEYYDRLDDTIDLIIAHGTKLYKLNMSTPGEPTVIKTPIANSEMKFFKINNKLYMINGTDYLVYDGNAVTSVLAEPYIPTHKVSKEPTGGGTVLEDLNLIGAGFKESFSGNGTATVYKMSFTNLDATTVTATVNEVEKLESTHFTVNRTTGDVTFTTAPPVGTNNVVITAYKTFDGFKEQILNCTIPVIYGGTNDTKVMLMGNSNMRNYIFTSGAYKPNYFPENGFVKVGSDSESILGGSVHYDTLVIHKEASKWSMSHVLENGEPTYPVKPLNDAIGCIAKNSIQLIENDPFTFTKKGVYKLVGGQVRDEKNVQHMSYKVDKLLLKEEHLEKAVSYDYDRKYLLCLNNKVYVYDYRHNVWYLWDNIPASCFLEIDGYLYFGSNTEGYIYRFMKISEWDAYSDNGVSINAYWKSKLIDFNLPESRKQIEKMFFLLKPSVRTSAQLGYTTDGGYSATVIRTGSTVISYKAFSYAGLSYATSKFPHETTAKIKLKDLVFLQIRLENNIADESMGILYVGVKYQVQGLIR